MLSYQHIYHAGCLADVHKHAALCALLELMVQKDKPLSYIETHAGRGLYDLNAPEAQKTGEFSQGIVRVRAENWFPEDHPYIRALNAVQAAQGENFYAGSAALAQHILRREDVMHLMELHPQEFRHLQASMGRRVNIYQRDGYENLLALSPPTPRRGIVFIDPSYEIKSEYTELPKVIARLIKKWPVAVICIWYPVLAAGLHREMLEDLQGLNIPKSDVFEVSLLTEKGMRGSGLFIANMPYGAQEILTQTEKFMICLNHE